MAFSIRQFLWHNSIGRRVGGGRRKYLILRAPTSFMEEVWLFLYEIFFLLFSFSLYIRLVMLQLLSQSLSWLGNLNGKKMGISEIPPGICRGGCPVGNPRGPTWNQRNRLRNDTLSKKGCLKRSLYQF